MPVLSNKERIGTLLGGRYRIERLLGEGGMGAVFAAEQVFTGRRVAVKLLHPESATRGQVMQRFMQEARAASAVNHPNIVQVLDMGADEAGALYLVMEYLEGIDLDHVLEHAPKLDPRWALEALLPVFEALAQAHDLGIIHRDLKPANIFLARQPDGTFAAKVLDFGISKVTGEGAMARTGTGAVLGTPFYMSPEQARGEKNLDLRIDVWAMGVVLYECLGGALPFLGENYNQVIVGILTEAPVPLAERVPGLPAAVVALVERALARARDGRYPDMRAFGEAVRQCLADPALPPMGASTGAVPLLASMPGVSSERAGTPVPLASSSRNTPRPSLPPAAPHRQTAVTPPPFPIDAVATGPGGTMLSTRTEWERLRRSNDTTERAARSPAARVLPIVAVGALLALGAGAAFALRPRAGASTPSAAARAVEPNAVPAPVSVRPVASEPAREVPVAPVANAAATVDAAVVPPTATPTSVAATSAGPAEVPSVQSSAPVANSTPSSDAVVAPARPVRAPREVVPAGPAAPFARSPLAPRSTLGASSAGETRTGTMFTAPAGRAPITAPATLPSAGGGARRPMMDWNER